jgi:hypothetical protein
MKVLRILFPFLLLLAGCTEEIQISPEILVLPDRLIVSPQTGAVLLGSTSQLSAHYINGRRGDTLAVPVSWVSLDPFATVDTTGLVRALQNGQARIVARYQAFADTALLTISDDSSALAIIRLTGPQLEVRVDSIFTIRTEGVNAVGNIVPLGAVNYTISDMALVTMVSPGRFKVNRAGTVQITVTSGGVSATTEVTLARGGVFRSNGGYRATGSVSLFVKNGVTQIRFSPDFSVSTGPDVRFYASINSTGNGVIAAGVEITSFPRDYRAILPAPASVGLYTYNNLVVQCRPFNVTFATAALR